MSTTVLTGARIFTGEAFVDGQALVIAEGRVAGLAPADIRPEGARILALPPDRLIAPGFIDIQVNGGGGVLFNDDPSPEAIRAIGAAHRRFGTTGFLPTLISDAPDRLPLALEAARSAIAADMPGVLGVHIEGPFINPARRGTHRESVLRPLAAAERALLERPTGGVTLVTVAPEIVPPADIAALVAAGLRVSLGHSACGYDTARAAYAAGASCATHLYNAMSPLTGREPGMVGAALDTPEAWCGLIVDGHHVHPASLRVALAAKPRGKCLLITDAMPPVGAASPSFTLYGETIRSEGGRCVNAEGALAGADLDMATAVRNAVHLLGLPLDEALRMAAAYPADFLGLGGRLGRLLPGHQADLVVLGPELTVEQAWIAGDPGPAA
ncbi:MAG TPA: N-acetylglucosamine-6-phosphate deacetylase [Alphaproteobacteria bacterium]|nr:N-acetylglucosamine-6-phosphate deacetylase [Alphaproteobacteria bacterium]